MDEIDELVNFRKLAIDLIKNKSDLDDLKDEKIKEIRSTIHSVCDLGIIKTHSLITSMVKDFIFSGKINNIKIKEVERDSPWKWDQISLYLTKLESKGILTFTRDESQYKICKLNLEGNSGSIVAIQLLLEYYTNFFKKEEFNLENISRSFLSMNCLLSKRDKLNKIKKRFENQKLQPISNKKLTEIVDEIIEANLQDSEILIEPTIGISKVLIKNPLFIKGISEGE